MLKKKKKREKDRNKQGNDKYGLQLLFPDFYTLSLSVTPHCFSWFRLDVVTLKSALTPCQKLIRLGDTTLLHLQLAFLWGSDQFSCGNLSIWDNEMQKPKHKHTSFLNLQCNYCQTISHCFPACSHLVNFLFYGIKRAILSIRCAAAKFSWMFRGNLIKALLWGQRGQGVRNWNLCLWQLNHSCLAVLLFVSLCIYRSFFKLF